MSRAYIGCLDENVTEEMLEDVLKESGIRASEVILKRGYAFVDVDDQQSLDFTIDALNGLDIMGSRIQVEPSTTSRRSKRGASIVVRGIPLDTPRDMLADLVNSHGVVESCDVVYNSMETSMTVTYEHPEQAEYAVSELHNLDFQGATLKVEYQSATVNGRGSRGAPRSPRTVGSGRGTGYPLRILVPSEFVGAIIGRKGQTIRRITTQCKARVDVLSKELADITDKVISIFGQHDNCSNAAKEILKVVRDECQVPTHASDTVCLKVLADDRFCGRVIGKGGVHIKNIREATNTKISVSRYVYPVSLYIEYVNRVQEGVQEVPALYPDRVISVRGALEDVSAAEARVSAVLRECCEREATQPMMVPTSTVAATVYGAGRGRPRGDRTHQNSGPSSPAKVTPEGAKVTGEVTGEEMDTLRITVPHHVVGIIIGSGGSSIKKIMRDSAAYVTVESQADAVSDTERVVSVRGSAEAQWRASYFIFDKLKNEGCPGAEDVKLKVSVQIPRETVGRVIGRGGQNVRDIQRLTGAMLKLPNNQDDGAQGDQKLELATVEVMGSFLATQNAISRVRSLVQYGMGAPSQHR